MPFWCHFVPCGHHCPPPLLFVFSTGFNQNRHRRSDEEEEEEGRKEGFCTWNNCPKWSKNASEIYVHLICHTHDDMGWLKTVDDYYTGANAQIYNVGVQYILSTVVSELQKDPSRRFSYAETGFLTKWLEDKSSIEVEMLRKLVVQKGQMEFIGGGWTQPDEATTHYYDLIDQYTLGLRQLAQKYGKCGVPKVAWQIDPFGHSREHANLVKEMGYEALFFARMHYAELAGRAKDRSLEMFWDLAAHGEKQSSMFTATFLRGTYGQPKGFCFDTVCGDTEPIVDDPAMDGYNIGQKVDEFMAVVEEQLKAQRHNHVFISMGNDFTYSNAATWFTNLDKLIRAINGNSSQNGVRLFYSTPSCYFKAIQEMMEEGKEENALKFPHRDGDFFPYASNVGDYWTGYFTSKPAFKGLIRRSSALLQLVRQFDGISLLLNPQNASKLQQKNLDKLERAQAVATHHDAITGTSKEAVTQDYEYDIFLGWDAAEQNLNLAMTLLATKGDGMSTNATFPEQKICRRLNESFCAESMDSGTTRFPVTIFNGNARKFVGLIRLPIDAGDAKVEDGNGQRIGTEVLPVFYPTGQQIQNGHPFVPAKFELVFNAEVEPVGFRTYFVTKLRDIQNVKSGDRSSVGGGQNANAADSSIQNKFIRLGFGPDGSLQTFEDLAKGKQYGFGQKFLAYIGGTSGAYLFRPNQQMATEMNNGKIQLKIIKGDLVQEARQIVSPWISQIIRLYADKPIVEFEFLIGPLPANESNPLTHEVVTRYTMPALKSNGIFWTDSNGRHGMERKSNHSRWFEFEEANWVTANYYPVTNWISLADRQSQMGMTLLVDRAQGGTSQGDGQLEIMVHRRCFQDDGLGVNENLYEPGEDGRGLIVRAKHWLHFGPIMAGVVARREMALALFHQPTLAFANSTMDWQEYAAKYNTQFSALLSPLPSNVNLLTFSPLKGGNSQKQILIRLEHIYEPNEHPILGQPIIGLNLRAHLKGLQRGGESVKEMALAGNKLLNYNDDNDDSDSDDVNVDIEQIRLEPMQIRTFLITLI